MNGWMGKIIRVNLTDETIKAEPLDMQDAKLYIGGRGLGSKIFVDEVDPKADAFSPENKIIIMTGPLTGTLADGAGRYAAVAKAPLTGKIRACGYDGHFGSELKFAGYDGMIFEGKAKRPVYLYIKNDHIELRDASHLWHKEASVVFHVMKKGTNEDAKIACIGPSAENYMMFDTDRNNDDRIAGRHELGAVMGSKNLKAIAVRGTKPVDVAESGRFLDTCLKARNIMKANHGTETGFISYGTEISGGSPDDFSEACETNTLCDKLFPGLSATGAKIEIPGIPATDNRTEALKILGNLSNIADCAGIGILTAFAIGLPGIAEMLKTCTGVSFTNEEVLKLGERVLFIENVFNLKSGL